MFLPIGAPSIAVVGFFQSVPNPSSGRVEGGPVGFSLPFGMGLTGAVVNESRTQGEQ